MRVRAPSILTLVLFALALGLSACSFSVKSKLDPLAAAAENTSAQKTMHFSMTMTEKMSLLPAPVTMTAEGDENLSEQKVSMSMDMSQMASLSSAQLGSPSDWKVDAVMDGLVMYMRFPFLTKELKLDKPWLKMDLESSGKKMGFDLSSMMNNSPDQVTQYLDYLRGAKGTLVLGHETIQGADTVHYVAKIDFDRYLDYLPADKRAAAKTSIDNLRKLANPQYGPFDVWVDSQNRIRREKFNCSETIASSGQTISITADVEMSDFNAPVKIVVPPADQTVDMQQLAGSLGTG